MALPEGSGAAVVPRLPTLFAEAYAAVFARSFPAEPIEIVNWKLEAIGPTPGRGADYLAAATASRPAIKGRRPAWFPEAGGFVDCAVYDRYALKPHDTFIGPAIVEEQESTAIVGVGDRATVDARGHLVVQVAEPKQ